MQMHKIYSSLKGIFYFLDDIGFGFPTSDESKMELIYNYGGVDRDAANYYGDGFHYYPHGEGWGDGDAIFAGYGNGYGDGDALDNDWLVLENA
jgi:hypothetical protein